VKTHYQLTLLLARVSGRMTVLLSTAPDT